MALVSFSANYLQTLDSYVSALSFLKCSVVTLRYSTCTLVTIYNKVQ